MYFREPFVSHCLCLFEIFLGLVVKPLFFSNFSQECQRFDHLAVVVTLLVESERFDQLFFSQSPLLVVKELHSKPVRHFRAPLVHNSISAVCPDRDGKVPHHIIGSLLLFRHDTKSIVTVCCHIAESGHKDTVPQQCLLQVFLCFGIITLAKMHDAKLVILPGLDLEEVMGISLILDDPL